MDQTGGILASRTLKPECFFLSPQPINLQISGKGFSGTYRLMHPYYPGPRELWGADYQEENKKTEKETPRKAKKRAVVEDSEDEEESEEEFSDDDGEVMPTPKKRGAPKQRSAVVAKSKKTVTKLMKNKFKAQVKTAKAKPASKGKAKKNKRKV